MARWCRSLTPAERRARRGRSSSSRLLEEKGDSAGGSERAHGDRQVKAGAWARGQAMAAARRASSTAVGTRGAARQRAGARRQARRGAALGWAGLSEARRAWEAGWADFGRGPEVRRRPAKEGKAFFICIFKEFLNAIFQILF